MCLLKDPILAQFTGADVAHITSPRIADVVKWFSKIDLSNVPLADDGALRGPAARCATICVSEEDNDAY